MARTTFSGPVASDNGFIPTSRFTPDNLTPITLTAAEVAEGYIAHEGAANITLTLPAAATVGTVQGIVPALNAIAGQTFDFQIEATAAGAGSVTLVLGAGGSLSALATAVGASAGLLVVAAGATGTATFRLTFTGGNPAATFTANIPNQPVQGTPGSATGYTLTRTA
jgi:hypothetical protein